MSNKIVVIAEHFGGHPNPARRAGDPRQGSPLPAPLRPVTFELLGEARRLARELNAEVEALLLGSSALALASALGAADRVVLVDHPALAEFIPELYAGIIANRLREADARLVLLGSTSEGLDLLSLLSARTGFPCFDNCTHFEVREGSLFGTSQTYGGKLFAEFRVPEPTALLGVTPGVFYADAGAVSGVPDIRTVTPSHEELTTRTAFRKLIVPPAADVDISKSEVLIAVGRGMQNADNLSLATDLAELLGGMVCASRPVIDQGWLPLNRQVGKSGVTVKARLYLAAGISGAPEHVEGIKGSDLIIAVNTDAAAPIFSVAHYGAVADALELLPALADELRKTSARRASAQGTT